MREMEEQIKTGNKKPEKELLIFVAAMLAADIVFLGLSAWIHELWWNEIVTAAAILIGFGGIYVWKVRRLLQKRLFWLIGLHILEFAVIFVSYQAQGVMRPIVAVPMLVALLAGMESGFLTLIFYSTVSAVICADPTEAVLLYLMSGFVGVWLLSDKKKSRDLFVGMASFFTVYSLSDIVFTLYAYAQLQVWDVVYGVVGGFLQLLPVCCFLPFLVKDGFSLPNVTGLAAATSEDFPALVEFKERKPVLYKHSRLVAGLSAQAAAEIGADALLAQAGGLYHEIGQGLGEFCDQESLGICKQYRLPASLQDIIKEHNAEKTPSSKESAVVMLSDTIITNMEKQRRKNPQGSADIPALVEKAFRIRENSGAFLFCGLTKEELIRLQEFYIRVLERV